MVKYIVLAGVLLLAVASGVKAQEQEDKTRFVAGISGPELIHAGITFKITRSNRIGVSAGAAPSWGTTWSSVNLENRLYVNVDSPYWFFRQGITYFPSASSDAQHFSFSLTAGRDFMFKNGHSGITVDGGVFYLAESEDSSVILIRSLNLWPALRVQLYFF